MVHVSLQKLIFPMAFNTRFSAALLLLRLFVGIAFIQHGSGKLMHPAEFAAEFGIPVSLALATMLTQVIGGILLILGAVTPLAALGIAGTMFTATVFLIDRGEPLYQSRWSQLGKFSVLSNSRHLPDAERSGSVVVGCMAVRSQSEQC
jgi:putative oxidoreductase